jgi:pimeloyl-ACP methyl ester carboxylesterase
MVVGINGIEQYWEEHGTGEPLLWLHGGMGHGADWKYIFNEVPDGFRLIAPDLRGHGSTANPGGVFSFRQTALDMIALVRHLRIARLKAIGLSGGGIVLLHMATIEPALLESMVIISAPPRFPEQARAVQRAMSPAMLGEAEMQRMRQRHVHGEAQIAQLIAMVHGFADDEHDVNFTRGQLSTIAAETLVVFGDHDFLYPASLALELHEAIPHSFLWVVPNGGHGPVFGEFAIPFVNMALPFLRGEWRRHTS